MEKDRTKASQDGGVDNNYYEVFDLGLNGRFLSFGLVGYWKMDEGSGTTAYGNNGTLVNGPTWTTGKVGGALSFDGVDDYVNFGDVLDIGTSDWSYGCWFKADWTAASQTKSIIAKSRYGSNIGRYYLVFESGYLRTVLQTSGGDKIINTSETPYLDGNWHHAFVTIDRDGLMKLYVDGVLKGSIDVSAGAFNNYNTPYPFGIGAYQNVGGTAFDRHWFKGLIDEVRVYNRALSDAEIKAIYEATK
ncbi:MAG: LamG domain-containing protein [Patescibacteria group bacterium]